MIGQTIRKLISNYDYLEITFKVIVTYKTMIFGQILINLLKILKFITRLTKTICMN